MTRRFLLNTLCCGAVEVEADEIDLLDFAGRITFTFLCPQCQGTVNKIATTAIATILVSGGVRYTTEGSVVKA